MEGGRQSQGLGDCGMEGRGGRQARSGKVVQAFAERRMGCLVCLCINGSWAGLK